MGSKRLIEQFKTWNNMSHTGKKELLLRDIEPGNRFICPSIELIGIVIEHGVGSSLIKVLSEAKGVFRKGKSITISLQTGVHRYR